MRDQYWGLGWQLLFLALWSGGCWFIYQADCIIHCLYSMLNYWPWCRWPLWFHVQNVYILRGVIHMDTFVYFRVNTIKVQRNEFSAAFAYVSFDLIDLRLCLMGQVLWCESWGLGFFLHLFCVLYGGYCHTSCTGWYVWDSCKQWHW